MLTDKDIARLRGELCLEEVENARDRIAEYLPRTPLIRHPLLVDELGRNVHVKHENHLPTGAFKVRGGLNYMAMASEADRKRGVVAATRGNHGQSVAYAAQLFGVRAVIVVPHGNNPEKNAAMRAYGAEVIEHGRDYDEARERVAELVDREGLRYVHSGNEPNLIHGVGTYSLEILEDLPEIDAIVLPIGGGSGICGAVTVFRALKPEVKIIGVQAENASCIFESWKRKEWVTTETADTIADGIATRVPMELPHAIILDEVDDILLVSDDDIREAMVRLLRTTHNLAEGAGAAGVAAIGRYPERFEGKNVAVVLSGGNLDMATLRSLF
jgi:threonine dehydratase